MQELKLIVAESDASSLVLRVVEPQDPAEDISSAGQDSTASATTKEFFLPVTDDLRRVLEGTTSGSEAGTSSSSPLTSVSCSTGSSNTDATTGDSALSAALSSLTAASGGAENSETSAPNEAKETENRSQTDQTDSANTDDGIGAEHEGVEEKKANEETNPTGEARVTGFGKFGRTFQRPHRTKISITPRTIQDRVRHGASIAELAEEADTDPSRIEPYAWPILQERSRIAELAHSAHPVSSDGPAKNSLWEVLATSLAARGESLSECEWDAYLNEAKQWIVTVSWNKTAAGQSATHVAEFLLQQQQPGPSLAQPINSIAGDLVDPRYGQAPRRVAAVTPLRWNDEPDDYNEGDAYGDSEDFTGDHVDRGARPLGANRAAKGADSPQDHAHRATSEHDETSGGDADEDFLLHPGSDDRPKRRRKAITPHWEDVLLGVRTNPRKKR